MTAPSGWTVNLAMSAASAALSRLEASGDVDTDEAAALAILREEAPEIDMVILRLLRAADEAEKSTDMIALRMSELYARRDRFKRHHEEYRRTVSSMLDALGLTKWKHPEYTAALRDGNEAVVIIDESALPEAMMRTMMVPDKKAIKSALEAGEVIPGAALTNGMPILTVRT